MDDTRTASPAGHATAVFEPVPALTCSHCGAALTDDDADCPACTTPIDWGASMKALREWQQHT